MVPEEPNAEEQIATELARLNELQGKLISEYDSGTLTSAQRIDCLKEQRRIIGFRCVLLGLIEPGADREI